MIIVVLMHTSESELHCCLNMCVVIGLIVVNKAFYFLVLRHFVISMGLND